VLEAIIVEGMETWQEIQKYTKLSNAAIKQALDELLDIKLLERVSEAKYRVRDSETIEEYKNYYQKLAPKLEKPPPPLDLQSSSSQKKPTVLSRLIDFSTQNRKNPPFASSSNDDSSPSPPPPSIYCRTCGIANPISRNYCGECGEKLNE
jgi:hypothetical protein